MIKIGILGSGDVAKSLANGCLKHEYQVKMGTSNPSKLSEWKSKAGSNGSIGSFSDAASFGDIIILAVNGILPIRYFIVPNRCSTIVFLFDVFVFPILFCIFSLYPSN